MSETWIADFVSCLDSHDKAGMSIERAFLIKHRHLPKAVYKFRAVNEFSIDNLQNGTVWLATPSDYNDPYDSTASISAEELLRETQNADFERVANSVNFRQHLTDEQVQTAKNSANPFEALSRMLVENNKNVRPEDRDTMLQIIKDINKDRMEKILREYIDAIRSSIKICSFCAISTPVAMWSHYADNHRGFCMEYDVSSLNPIAQRMLFPVIYDPSMFDATKYLISSFKDLPNFNNTYAQLQALYKSPDWAYEQEWRLVFIAGFIPQARNWPFGQASRVHLGSKISEENKTRIIEICKGKGIPVNQMQLSSGSYDLTSAELTT